MNHPLLLRLARPSSSRSVPRPRPPPPDALNLWLPDDTGRSISPPSDPTLRYYRTVVRVAFYDTTGG